MHATPDTDDRSQRQSRIESLEEDSPHRRMPDAGIADYLLQELFLIGICSSGANGPVPLTWSELKSYTELASVEFDPWECETLIELSRAYVSGLLAARDANMPPPYLPDDPESVEAIKKAEAARMKRAFGLG